MKDEHLKGVCFQLQTNMHQTKNTNFSESLWRGGPHLSLYRLSYVVRASTAQLVFIHCLFSNQDLPSQFSSIVCSQIKTCTASIHPLFVLKSRPAQLVFIHCLFSHQDLHSQYSSIVCSQIKTSTASIHPLFSNQDLPSQSSSIVCSQIKTCPASFHPLFVLKSKPAQLVFFHCLFSNQDLHSLRHFSVLRSKTSVTSVDLCRLLKRGLGRQCQQNRLLIFKTNVNENEANQ